MAPLEPASAWLSFKCGEEEFAELIERPGIIPAPYLARAKWVALEHDAAIDRAEIERLLETAHGLVFAKLPKKVRTQLSRQKTRRSGKSHVRRKKRQG